MVIKKLRFIRESSPVAELLLVVFTALLQYPNSLIRQTGDIVMEDLLVDCSREKPGQVLWLWKQEEQEEKGGVLCMACLGDAGQIVANYHHIWLQSPKWKHHTAT